MKKRNTKYLILFLLSSILITFPVCSKYTYKTIYNQLDLILYLEVVKYFNPDEQQKEFARNKLFSLLIWNRENALPRYRDILVYMKNSVQKGLTEENLVSFYDKFDNEYEILADKAAPDAALFVMSLNKKQIDSFRKEMVSSRKEEEKKHDAEGKDSAERKTHSVVKFLSNIYGPFSDEQTEKIKEYMTKNPEPDFDRWKYNEAKLKEFLELMNKKPDNEKVALFLKSWTTRNYDSLPEPFKDNLKAQRKYNINLYLHIDKNIVTEQQREAAIANIGNWIDTADVLLSER